MERSRQRDQQESDLARESSSSGSWSDDDDSSSSEPTDLSWIGRLLKWLGKLTVMCTVFGAICFGVAQLYFPYVYRYSNHLANDWMVSWGFPDYNAIRTMLAWIFTGAWAIGAGLAYVAAYPFDWVSRHLPDAYGVKAILAYGGAVVTAIIGVLALWTAIVGIVAMIVSPIMKPMFNHGLKQNGSKTRIGYWHTVAFLMSRMVWRNTLHGLVPDP
jgi:hypothetical protein